MLEIAGGIIIAALFFVFLPKLIQVMGWLLAATIFIVIPVLALLIWPSQIWELAKGIVGIGGVFLILYLNGALGIHIYKATAHRKTFIHKFIKLEGGKETFGETYMMGFLYGVICLLIGLILEMAGLSENIGLTLAAIIFFLPVGFIGVFTGRGYLKAKYAQADHQKNR